MMLDFNFILACVSEFNVQVELWKWNGSSATWESEVLGKKGNPIIRVICGTRHFELLELQ